MAQKIHNHGAGDKRYFWDIKTDLAEGEYRSRCSTSKAVRAQLTKLGHTVTSVKAAQA